jgi:hypothetical protein
MVGWGEMIARTYSNAQESFLTCDPILGLRINSNTSEETTGPLLYSTRTLNLLRPRQVDDSQPSRRFVLEVWLTPFEDREPDSIKPLITIMPEPFLDPTESQNNSSISLTRNDFCSDLVDLELSTYRNHLLLQWRSNDDDNNASLTCRTLFLSTVLLIPQELVQFVLVFDYDSHQHSHFLKVFWNGQALYQAAILVDVWAARPVIQSWSPSSRLWLFGNLLRTTPFWGALAQVSMYGDDVDSDSDIGAWVQQRYDEGTVRSEPLVLSVIESSTPLRIDQDARNPMDILVQSWNASMPWFQIALEILREPTFGALSYSKSPEPVNVYDDSVMITTGTVVAFPSSPSSELAKLMLQYTLDGTNYFNAPSTNAYGEVLPLKPESWEYRLVAHDAQGRQLAVSATMTQPITVVHVNHPPMLTGPAPVDPSNIDGSMAVVSGIKLADAPRDYNIDRVRVDVWATSGYLTLPSLHLQLADFDSCRGRTLSPWQCVGDGKRNRNMTFLAIPDDIHRILNGLTYEAMAPQQQDEIVIRVSDGQDGECLSASEQQQYTDSLGNAVVTSQRGCFQDQLRVYVPALQFDPRQQQPLSSTRGFLGTRLNTAQLLFWTLVLVFLACFGCCLRRCSRCLARGSKVEVDDDVNVHEDRIERRASF